MKCCCCRVLILDALKKKGLGPFCKGSMDESDPWWHLESAAQVWGEPDQWYKHASWCSMKRERKRIREKKHVGGGESKSWQNIHKNTLSHIRGLQLQRAKSYPSTTDTWVRLQSPTHTLLWHVTTRRHQKTLIPLSYVHTAENTFTHRIKQKHTFRRARASCSHRHLASLFFPLQQVHLSSTWQF